MSLPIKITLPEGFLNREVRSGYEVSEKLKKIWAVDADLFFELSRVCKKLDIKFQIAFGTQIGAVRHEGFIPWDDDFDVWMSRSDIDKLIMHADEFAYPYFLQTPLNDRKFLSPLTRLRNSATTGAVSGCESVDYNNGIYVDIYAMDGLSDSKIRCAIQYILKRIVVKLWALRGAKRPLGQDLKQRVLFFAAKPLSLILSYEQWYKLYVGVLSMWNDSTDKLSHMVTSTIRGKHNWINKIDLEQTVEVDFEWFKVPIPKNYHQILSRDYGDYMQFPPAEERGKWHEGIIHFEPEIPYKEYLKNHYDTK